MPMLAIPTPQSCSLISYLSKEGQSLTANVIGSYPANPNVESELRKKTAGYSIHPVNPKMMSRFEEINKQYMEIFWKNP